MFDGFLRKSGGRGLFEPLGLFGIAMWLLNDRFSRLMQMLFGLGFDIKSLSFGPGRATTPLFIVIDAPPVNSIGTGGRDPMLGVMIAFGVNQHRPAKLALSETSFLKFCNEVNARKNYSWSACSIFFNLLASLELP